MYSKANAQIVMPTESSTER